MNENDPLYGEYNAQIAQMEKMVTSLNAFHDQTKALDANHQNQVSNLNTVIQALFENPDTFTGSAAHSLQDVVSNYLQAEHAFTGYPGDTSPQLAEATRYCQTTASNIESELQVLYKDSSAYADQLATLASENVVEREFSYLLEGPLLGDLASDVQAYANDQCFLPPQTPQLVSQMATEEWGWKNRMDALAGEGLPYLPPTPTDPAPFNAEPESILYPANQQSLDDLQIKWIAEELRNEGYIIDDAEVAALWNAGYRNPEEIKARIRGGAQNTFTEERYQLQKATQLANLAAQARKQGDPRSNYGGGYFELRDANGTIVYQSPLSLKSIMEGQRNVNVDAHSEGQTIADIAENLEILKNQGKLSNVKIINVLIFTRMAPCSFGPDTCKSRMLDTESKKGWIPQISNSSGIKNIVMTVWHMSDVRGSINQNNLHQAYP